MRAAATGARSSGEPRSQRANQHGAGGGRSCAQFEAGVWREGAWQLGWDRVFHSSWYRPGHALLLGGDYGELTSEWLQAAGDTLESFPLERATRCYETTAAIS